MIDFARFKAEYAEKHLALVSETQTNQTTLGELTILLGQSIDRKMTMERRRAEIIQEE